MASAQDRAVSSLGTRSSLVLAFACTALLSGCNTVVLNPSGYIAEQQAQLLIISTLLMLLIIVPVIVLTFVFAWRYRASNKDAPYTPDWDHSIQLELLIWSAPLLIIIALGALTWIGTHTLDPYRPLDVKQAPRDLPPIEIQVVALDWKWLFIYPEQNIALVNEVAAPVDVPIRFKITSQSVMNAFYVPALAGMIYAMPNSETSLHAVINKPGNFEGFSANYSGAGFSHMKFRFHGMSAADFDAWVQQQKASGQVLDRATYLQLEKPTEREPVRRYGRVEPNLFDLILNRCVAPGQKCHRDLMAEDLRRQAKAAAARGGRTTVAQNAAPDAFVCTARNPSGRAANLTTRN